MKQFRWNVLMVVLVTLTGQIAAGASEVQIDKMRCEYMCNPLGIDVLKPRLSWIIKSDERGQKQTAYQVLVADSREKLAEDKGNLWDTGKVASSRTAHIVYDGKKLKSRMRCYWKVRVWDKDGAVSGWSESAMWTMGLLDSGNWQAKWIGLNKPKKKPQPNILKQAMWIWYPEGDPIKGLPDCVRYFRQHVNIPAGKEVKAATLAMTADNQFTVFVNGDKVGRSNFHIPFEVDVARYLRSGENIIAVEAENIGNRPTTPAALIGALQVQFEDGEELYVRTDGKWLANDEKEGGWQEPAFEDADWRKALAVGKCGVKPWGDVSKRGLILPPPTYLRESFKVEKPVRRATAYASALGLYELRLNGEKIGDDYFTPGWTDYHTRVYYNTYDVSSLVNKGANAVGAVLADGWYAGYVGWGRKRWHYGEQTRVRVQLEIEYKDGTRKAVATGSDWRATMDGPLFEADFLMGEGYDARRQMSGWDKAGYDDSGWDDVVVDEKADGKVEAYPAMPVREFAEVEPVEITEPVDDVYIYNMGQNFAGWVRLKVNGDAGDKVVLRFGERLNPDGTLYTMNLRSARARDTYICRGGGVEVWSPRFTFHGFQYVEVTGYPGKPGPEAITGVAVSSDMPVVGSFECSSDMANQLYSNIYWTQRANFIEVPTDCPQRDERLGWMGDAQAFIRAGTYNTDVAAFFTKWMVDIDDAQSPKGAFPDYAPNLGVDQTASPGWGDAGVICPWTIYKVYGDKRILHEHYDAMSAWIEYCRHNSDNLIRPPRGYGDWLNIDAETPKDVIATAYFARSTQLTAEIAEVLGKEADAAKYRRLWGKIRDAFNEAFVDEYGIIKGDTQTAYVLAIAFDLVQGDMGKAAGEHLIDGIKDRGWRLSTGFLGTKDLMMVLNKLGRVDVAYKLFMNDKFPSWFFCIKHGATSIWERWDGWTPENGFQNAGMNSFAHYAFGSVGEWMFRTIGGIDTSNAGYTNIVIKPRPGGGLSYAKSSYECIHGEIATGWRIEGDKLRLEVVVPCNTQAVVYIPTSEPKAVTEGDEPVEAAEGIEVIEFGDGAAVLKVESGRYSFVGRK